MPKENIDSVSIASRGSTRMLCNQWEKNSSFLDTFRIPWFHWPSWIRQVLYVIIDTIENQYTISLWELKSSVYMYTYIWIYNQNKSYTYTPVLFRCFRTPKKLPSYAMAATGWTAEAKTWSSRAGRLGWRSLPSAACRLHASWQSVSWCLGGWWMGSTWEHRWQTRYTV